MYLFFRIATHTGNFSPVLSFRGLAAGRIVTKLHMDSKLKPLLEKGIEIYFLATCI